MQDFMSLVGEQEPWNMGMSKYQSKPVEIHCNNQVYTMPYQTIKENTTHYHV